MATEFWGKSLKMIGEKHNKQKQHTPLDRVVLIGVETLVETVRVHAQND